MPRWASGSPALSESHGDLWRSVLEADVPADDGEEEVVSGQGHERVFRARWVLDRLPGPGSDPVGILVATLQDEDLLAPLVPVSGEGLAGRDADEDLVRRRALPRRGREAAPPAQGSASAVQ